MRSATWVLILVAAGSLLGPLALPATHAAGAEPDPALAGGIGAFKGIGAPAHPRVSVRWDRYYDTQGLADIERQLAAAHPGLCHLESIGKSEEGRDLWELTITDFASGAPGRKAGFYIDGNIHSNEAQASEVALYTAWYLLENYGSVESITRLLKERVFYIVPTIDPDGRDDFFHHPNTPDSPRSGMAPRDNDLDGRIGEDRAVDLDGDGSITMMRKADPNGRWKTSPDDPRLMVPCAPDEPGQWTMLGMEGLDQDGDGRVSEEFGFYYDPNRDWGWDWQPRYIQNGADRYPFSFPETRAVKDFFDAHPNIAGAQTYHNAAGLILRGPGDRADVVQPGDASVYDFIGKQGEAILPGYRYAVVWKDLYTVYGGEIDWFYGARGILGFTNELWLDWNMFRREPAPGAGRDAASPDVYKFDRLVLMGDGIVPWHKFHHPQFGDIEIGGIKKEWTRMPPTFLLEEECHRNMAFTLFHAWCMPLLRIDTVRVTQLPGGLRQVDATIVNERPMPTHTGQDLLGHISPPDVVTLETGGGRVLAGFRVENEYLGNLEEQRVHPDRIQVPGISGNGVLKVRWIVEGGGAPRVRVASPRASLAGS